MGGSWLDLDWVAMFAMEKGGCQSEAGEHQHSPWDPELENVGLKRTLSPGRRTLGLAEGQCVWKLALSLGEFFCSFAGPGSGWSAL